MNKLPNWLSSDSKWRVQVGVLSAVSPGDADVRRELACRSVTLLSDSSSAGVLRGGLWAPGLNAASAVAAADMATFHVRLDALEWIGSVNPSAPAAVPDEDSESGAALAAARVSKESLSVLLRLEGDPVHDGYPLLIGCLKAAMFHAVGRCVAAAVRDCAVLNSETKNVYHLRSDLSVAVSVSPNDDGRTARMMLHELYVRAHPANLARWDASRMRAPA